MMAIPFYGSHTILMFQAMQNRREIEEEKCYRYVCCIRCLPFFALNIPLPLMVREEEEYLRKFLYFHIFFLQSNTCISHVTYDVLDTEVSCEHSSFHWVDDHKLACSLFSKNDVIWINRKR